MIANIDDGPFQAIGTPIVRDLELSKLPCVAHSPGAGRHDDPEEKKADEIRAEIRASHRFDSFADEREENFVKWCVCPV
jgi:predicted neutral ceramidase superfamily lipid hydrolase